MVQIGNEVSNSTRMPVAPKGSRNCTPVDPAFTGVNIEQGVMAGPVSFGDIKLHKSSNFPSAGYADVMKHDFAKILTYAPGSQPFFSTYGDQLPSGTCQVANNLNPPDYLPIASASLLDAGANLTITGPNGSTQIPLSGDNRTTLSGAGSYLAPGASYTIAGNGGNDVGRFSTSITFPRVPNLTSPNPNSPATVTRANGLTFTWPAGTQGSVQILIGSATDATFTNGALAFCSVDESTGTFTVPGPIMLALPPGSNALYLFGAASRAQFSASGLNVGIMETQNDGIGGGLNLQ